MIAAFYAPLLTDRQQSMLQMYCDEDLSLSEIASQYSISRQAVSDNLNRAYERLDDLEDQLKMYQKFVELKDRMTECTNLLSNVEATGSTEKYLQQALSILTDNEEHLEDEKNGI